MNMNKILMNVPRKHKLLTKEIETKLPEFYSNEGIPLENRIARVKFFTPASNWTWYGLEYDPSEKLFYGYVDGFEREFGYFSLEELEAMNSAVERDIGFTPKPLGQIYSDLIIKE